MEVILKVQLLLFCCYDAALDRVIKSTLLRT
jgi:hypothetical protein